MPVRTCAGPTIRRSSSWKAAGTAISRPLDSSEGGSAPLPNGLRRRSRRSKRNIPAREKTEASRIAQSGLLISCFRLLTLEALGQALGFDRMRTVGDARLTTGLARGEDLAGIAQAARVPGVPYAAHGVQVRLGEDERHVVDLLEPDAVLARDRAADFRA